MTDHMDVNYIIEQIGEIHKQSSYLNEAIGALSQMHDGDSGDCGAPGNISGQEKAKALGDVVRCRETTNQRLIEFYEMVYRDLRNLNVPPASEASSPQQGADSSFDAFDDLLSASKAFAAHVSHQHMAAEQ